MPITKEIPMTSVVEASSTEEPVVIISRIFDAPRELLWTNAAEDERRGAGGPPKAVTTVTLEALGVRTRWTLVARFNSIAERDISVKMGFGHTISQGAERMAEHLKAL